MCAANETKSDGDQERNMPDIRDAKAIDWADFKDSFLPAAEEICNIAVSKGLVKQINNKYDCHGV